MPECVARRQRLLLLRKVVKSALGIGRGIGGLVEASVVAVARQLHARLTPAEEARLDTALPEWMTDDAIKALFTGTATPHTPVATPSVVVVDTPKAKINGLLAGAGDVRAAPRPFARERRMQRAGYGLLGEAARRRRPSPHGGGLLAPLGSAGQPAGRLCKAPQRARRRGPLLALGHAGLWSKVLVL